MSGTGYASVGHLLDITKRHSSLDYKSILLKLVEHIYAVDIDGSISSREGFKHFETFFNEIEVSVESGRKYLSGLLQLSIIDDSSFEREVEELAWSLIKSDYGFYLPYSNDIDEEDKDKEEKLCFQLFCIFNRFCETTLIPMQLENNAKNFLFKKFGWPHLIDKNKQRLSFRQFYEQVSKRRDGFMLINVKKSYDEYVHDIMKEGNILFRPRTFSRSSGKEKGKSGK